ncbi:MAG: ribose 5-phosphate isomerase B [Desulfovibrionaceae bacterium]|nr:ribose 5-phosphate isomerase B [Desulfovibrionaceae bacterium]
MNCASVVIASDHGGFGLKKTLVGRLAARRIEVLDLGPDCAETCDYPVFAKRAVRKVLELEARGCLGVLICGTGLGMSMTANRFPGIRAAVCVNEYMARMARAHNNANLLCLGERVVGPGLAVAILDVFLSTAFEGGRHQARINLIEAD